MSGARTAPAALPVDVSAPGTGDAESGFTPKSRAASIAAPVASTFTARRASADAFEGGAARSKALSVMTGERAVATDDSMIIKPQERSIS